MSILDRPTTIFQAAVKVRAQMPSGTTLARVTTRPGERGAVTALCVFNNGQTIAADFIPPGKQRIAAPPDLKEAERQFVGILGFLGRRE